MGIVVNVRWTQLTGHRAANNFGMFGAIGTGSQPHQGTRSSASILPHAETISPLARTRGFPGHHTPRGDDEEDNLAWWDGKIVVPQVLPGLEREDQISLSSKLFDYRDPESGVKEECPRWRQHHNSTVRKTWDSMTIVLLLYMSLALPVTVGFGIESSVTAALSSIIDVFFIIDLFLNFVTTFEDDSKIFISGYTEIAQHYLKTWFPIDFLSSIPLQWFPGLQDDSATDAVRALKILKLVKLLRIFRLGRMIARLQERFQIKHATVMIVQFIGFIFVV